MTDIYNLAKLTDCIDEIPNTITDEEIAIDYLRAFRAIIDCDTDRIAYRYLKMLQLMAVLASAADDHFDTVAHEEKAIIVGVMGMLVYTTASKAYSFLAEKGVINAGS